MMKERILKKSLLDRYVKREMGWWTDLPLKYRFFMAPIYALTIWIWCVKGIPIAVQILHEEEYDPEYEALPSRRICPRCDRYMDEEVKFQFRVSG